MRIVHVALVPDWQQAEANGSYDVSTRGVGLAEADFIHASTASQVRGVLDGFYADVAEVAVLVVDVERLEHEGATVAWEDVEGVGVFPHVYGVIPVVAVVDVVRLAHAPGETWTLPDLASHGVLAAPPTQG